MYEHCIHPDKEQKACSLNSGNARLNVELIVEVFIPALRSIRWRLPC